jgi:hypothetical protein
MRASTLGVIVALGLSACAAVSTSPSTQPPDTTTAPTTTSSTTTTTTTSPPETTTTTPATPTTLSPYSRPAWLGTRPLPLGPDGETAIPQPTPPELQNRQFETIDYLPPPPDNRFVSTIGPIPNEVLARSTWSAECPVALDELSYVTVSHYGFEGNVHTGELIVNASVADDVVSVFHKLFDAKFPIEEMRVTSQADLDAAPTGDGNDTGSFVCRPVVGSDHWSQHAYGLAVDINPFQNPYVKGDVIIPELAGSYTNRDWARPGMIFEDDVVFSAFADIGWTWGGDWQTLKDRMHFSENGT